MKVDTLGPDLAVGVKNVFLEENLELSSIWKVTINFIKQQG